jgi:hypothetical protein
MPATARSPRLAVRIVLWLAVYLTGGALFLLHIVHHDNPSPFWDEAVEALVFYPAMLSALVPDLVPPANFTLECVVCYGIYLVNFIFTLRVARPVAFFIMLALLIVLIGLTLLGQERFEAHMDAMGPWQD